MLTAFCIKMSDGRPHHAIRRITRHIGATATPNKLGSLSAMIEKAERDFTEGRGARFTLDELRGLLK